MTNITNMPSLIERKNIVYAPCGIQIPLDLKTKAQNLGINLTQAAIAGIEAEVAKVEKEKSG